MSIYTSPKGKNITIDTYLDPIDSGVVIRDSMAIRIINKIIAVEGTYFKTSVLFLWLAQNITLIRANC